MVSGTVKPKNDFDAEEGAKQLREAMKGFGADATSIIQVAASHSTQQRVEIAEAYKTLYGRDLHEDLTDETHGKFEDLLLALHDPLPMYYAKAIHNAISGAGTDELTLVEVLCTSANSMIEAIKECYQKEYDEDLEEALKSDVSKHFEHLLVAQLNASRDQSWDVDMDLAAEDAQSIIDATEGIGTDESAFNAVLCRRSAPQLRATFEKYNELAGKDIDETIQSECTGTLQDGYLTIVRYVRNPQRWVAQALHDKLAGAGTDDDGLIRLVVARAELDLVEVMEQYVELYEESLPEAIASDTHGKLEQLLLALINA